MESLSRLHHLKILRDMASTSTDSFEPKQIDTFRTIANINTNLKWKVSDSFLGLYQPVTFE